VRRRVDQLIMIVFFAGGETRTSSARRSVVGEVMGSKVAVEALHHLKPLTVGFAILLSWAASAVAQSQMSGIELVTSASVSAPPDTAEVVVGVTATSRRADEALARARKAYAASLDVVKAFGIPDSGIQTNAINVRPIYPRVAPPSGEPVKIENYTAELSVSITSKDLERFGALLEELVKNGSNEVRGFSYRISDEEPFRRQAYDLAIKLAKERAELMASSLGVKLGAPILLTTQVSEQQVGGRKFSPTSGSRLPLALRPGNIEVKVDLRSVWAIER
jgi:uncharacterized protein